MSGFTVLPGRPSLTDQELRGWVQGLTVEQREKFVDSAFQVLEASGAQTLTDLKADSFKAVRPMVRALKDLDKETREALLKFMSILFMSNLRMTLEGIQEETEKSLLRNGKKAAEIRREEGINNRRCSKRNVRLCRQRKKQPASDIKSIHPSLTGGCFYAWPESWQLRSRARRILPSSK